MEEHEQLEVKKNGTEPEEVTPRRAHSVRNIALAFLVAVPAILFWVLTTVVLFGVVAYMTETTDSCNIARVQLQGVLVATDNGLGQLMNFSAITSADSVIEEIRRAEEDDTIEAILIDVDSPGGTPVAGDEILSAIAESRKPTVALIRDQGTSAAYWAIASAEHIIASPVSDVGSIGVTMSYLELAGATEYEGTRWVDISSGEFKDAGNPERPLSEEEEQHFKAQVDAVHQYMIARISGARSSLTEEALGSIADGRSFLGTEAVELKLVDEVGGFSEAITYLSNRLGIFESEVVLCEPSEGGLDALLY